MTQDEAQSIASDLILHRLRQKPRVIGTVALEPDRWLVMFELLTPDGAMIEGVTAVWVDAVTRRAWVDRSSPHSDWAEGDQRLTKNEAMSLAEDFVFREHRQRPKLIDIRLRAPDRWLALFEQHASDGTLLEGAVGVWVNDTTRQVWFDQ